MQDDRNTDPPLIKDLVHLRQRLAHVEMFTPTQAIHEVCQKVGSPANLILLANATRTMRRLRVWQGELKRRDFLPPLTNLTIRVPLPEEFANNIELGESGVFSSLLSLLVYHFMPRVTPGPFRDHSAHAIHLPFTRFQSVDVPPTGPFLHGNHSAAATAAYSWRSPTAKCRSSYGTLLCPLQPAGKRGARPFLEQLPKREDKLSHHGHVYAEGTQVGGELPPLSGEVLLRPLHLSGEASD